MKEEVEDALYGACQVTRHSTRRMRLEGPADFPMQGRGPLVVHPPSSVAEFKAKLRAFLGELDSTATVRDILDALDEL